MSEKRGFRPADAARYTGFPRSAIYEAIKDGSLVSYKVGRARMFLREDLDDWLESQTVAAHGSNRAAAESIVADRRAS